MNIKRSRGETSLVLWQSLVGWRALCIIDETSDDFLIEAISEVKFRRFPFYFFLLFVINKAFPKRLHNLGDRSYNSGLNILSASTFY